MSTDLDDLEAKARAAQTAGWYEPEPDSWPDPFTPSPRDAAFISACDPDTVLHLIERVRAGEELYKVTAEEHRGSAYSHCRLCRWARRWESLAHSPQEAV